MDETNGTFSRVMNSRTGRVEPLAEPEISMKTRSWLISRRTAACASCGEAASS